MDPTPSFSRFGILPAELRLQIWEYCLPGPRIVPVRYSRTIKQYISSKPPPSMLHACSESRDVFLSQYTKLILSPKYPSSIYISFASDTVFFDSLDCSPEGDLAYDLACSPHRDRILSCAIDVQLWEVLRVFRYDSLSEVRLLENLQRIALIIRKSRGSGYPEGVGESVEGLEGLETTADEAVFASLASDRSDSLFYTEHMRKMLESCVKKHWGNELPCVYLWLW